MDKEELLNLITIEDIIHILKSMGSADPKTDPDGNLYFQTICHGGNKHKLHFFTDSKFFMCYTNCGSMSLFDVLMNINDWKFSEAFHFLMNYKGIKSNNNMKIGLQESKYENPDIDFLNKHLYKPKKKNINLPTYNKNILNVFDRYYPDSWIDEGIKEEVMDNYDIRFYFNQYKAVIPHYDINGKLIGIKSRNFLKHEIDQGRKYIPITIQGLTYRYPKSFNLYGLYQNKDNIKKLKKAIIFESEKSVLKFASIYGQENNITLASGGMDISLYQRDLLLNLGIEEVIIALDKQYQLEYLKAEYKDTKQYKEYTKFVKGLYKIAKLFIGYCNVSFILCWDDRLDYKDSPIDKSKDIFEELLKERYLIEDLNEFEEMVE